MSLHVKVQLLRGDTPVHTFAVPSGYIAQNDRERIAWDAVDQLKIDIPFAARMGKPISDDWDGLKLFISADDTPVIPRAGRLQDYLDS